MAVTCAGTTPAAVGAAVGGGSVDGPPTPRARAVGGGGRADPVGRGAAVGKAVTVAEAMATEKLVVEVDGRVGTATVGIWRPEPSWSRSP